MKKKIGVLTFHNGPNFGGFLQAWHMVNALRELGHDGHAVNYLHPEHQRANEVRVPIRSLGALKGRIFWALKKKPFRGLGNSMCKHRFTADADEVPWEDFEAFVVGSDIVWDYQNPDFGHDPVYFGMHPEQADKRMIAYAASCGPASPNGPFPDYVKSGVKRFEALGLRDPNTAALAKNAGDKESQLVVDPTWLGDDPVPEWPGRPKEKYVFVYGGKVDEKLGSALAGYCENRGLKLVTAMTSCRWADKKYHSLHPFEWVDLFRNAEAVVVQGTLHGTVYSIKYGKPFIHINGDRTRAKISGILKTTGQSHRALEPGEVGPEQLELLDKSVPKAADVCAEWIQESKDFLTRSLEGVPCGS